MSIQTTPHHGIFYLEGFWEGPGETPSESTVRPMLEMMERSLWDRPEASHAHHQIHTRKQFNRLLAHWAENLIERMPILVLAFPDDFKEHGSDKATGHLRFGHDRDTNEWSDCGKVAALIKKHRPGDAPFIVHFSTSRGLGNPTTSDRHARKFLDDSGAVAVSWYRDDVDWHDATALDLLWFNRLMGKKLTVATVGEAEQELQGLAGGLMKRLGFVCVTPKGGKITRGRQGV